MKLLIRGINENNLEEIALKLSELDINPTPLYRSVHEGKNETVVECDEEKYSKLKAELGSVCQMIVVDAGRARPVSLVLLSLFLDNLLVFYMLKFSVWSEDFANLLSRLFYSTKAVVWSKLIMSLILIYLYQHAFFHSKGAPPISHLLGLKYTKDKNWVMFSYSLPLVALYMMNTGFTFIKLLGLFLLSLSVAILIYQSEHKA